MWASCPIFVFVLFLVPLVIIFEGVFAALIIAVLGSGLIILVPIARGYHIFAYPLDKRYRSKWQVKPFLKYDDERRPFTD